MWYLGQIVPRPVSRSGAGWSKLQTNPPKMDCGSPSCGGERRTVPQLSLLGVRFWRPNRPGRPPWYIRAQRAVEGPDQRNPQTTPKSEFRNTIGWVSGTGKKPVLLCLPCCRALGLFHLKSDKLVQIAKFPPWRQPLNTWKIAEQLQKLPRRWHFVIFRHAFPILGGGAREGNFAYVSGLSTFGGFSGPVKGSGVPLKPSLLNLLWICNFCLF